MPKVAWPRKCVCVCVCVLVRAFNFKSDYALSPAPPPGPEQRLERRVPVLGWLGVLGLWLCVLRGRCLVASPCVCACVCACIVCVRADMRRVDKQACVFMSGPPDAICLYSLDFITTYDFPANNFPCTFFHVASFRCV